MLEFIKKLGFIKLAAIGGFSLAFLVLFVILTHSARMKPLYANLTPTDKYEVARFLSQIGVNYVVDESSILVNSNKVRELRMFLAAEGIPSNGSIIGYEIFNKEDSFSTSSFTQNVNLLRALEGELARTIMSFDQVKTARVHLVLPKHELFNREKQKATASVMLRLATSGALSQKEIKAIGNFVASAVPGLSVNDVTIVSSDGRAFKSANDEEDASLADHEYKVALEKHLTKTIEELLGKSVGPGKVKAEVSVDIDFDQVITDAEIYDPSGQVVRSTQVIEERTQGSTSGGNVSVENSIPNAGDNGDVNNTSNSNRSDETKNYEISREKRQIIKKGGTIKSMSIAVLVDGLYNQDPNGGEEVYTPRDEETLAKFYTLIASAVGFNAERGDKLEVINLRFLKETTLNLTDGEVDGFVEKNLLYIITTLAVLLALIIIVVAGIKPIIIKILEQRSAIAQPPELIMPEEEDKEIEEDLDDDLSALSKQKLVKNLNTLVDRSPENAVSMLRKWMDTGAKNLNRDIP